MSELRATPQNAALGAIARALQGTHDFVSKPFGYENPPVQMLSELLGVPATARTLERLSYGQPITNVNKANVPLLPDDTAEAAMTVVPPLASLAKRVGTNMVQTAPYVARDIVQSMTAPTRSYIVPPKGNLNLTPMSRAEVLKGPEAQTPENFLNQLRGKPGMTQEGFDDLVKQYQGLEPNTRMTKAEFEQRIPASEYNKVDLLQSAGDTDAHWLTEAENMVMQDQSEIYENMLDRLGAKINNTNVDLLQSYYNKNLTFEELSPDLKKALTRAEANGPDKMNALRDLYDEERNNSINNTYEYIRERMQDEGSGYQGVQRLLENPDRSAEGYFELGVTHPEQTATYKHYSGYRGDDGLIGHVRGTFIPADAADETRKLINPILSSDEVILAKPNSMVIEEIQSDAQKGVAQTGALRQAHGTMFKAAIQHALEGGVDTVYYPTAKTIGGVRIKESSAYAPIYDQQIIKEGLKPLLKIPGVDSRKIGDAYYEINFTPEAKDFILKGEGQAAPGYAEGGSVVKNAATDFMKFLDAQGLSMSDVVAAFGKRGIPLSAAFYSGDLGKDEDLELRARRMQKPTITEPKYADGGPVRAGEGLPDPTLMNLTLYADTVSREMFPNSRDNPKRDAARHMLASALAAQKTTPTIAGWLGKAHELKEAPFRTAGHWLGLSEPRSDYPTDVHNNDIGIQLGRDNRSLQELLDSVEREAQRGTPETQKGRASLKPDAVSKTRYAEGGMVGTPLTTYDPMQVDQIMNSINAPRNYAQGGSVDTPDLEFNDDPEAMRLYRHAMKQTTPNPEEVVSNFGTGVRARVAGGDLSAGLDMNRMTQGERDQLMKMLAANYNVNLGDLNLNASVQKPLDAKDIYAGLINGSIPLGTGRAMLGVQGMKTPYGSGVTGYNAGWSGQVGPGNLSANVNIPKRGSRSAQVQYQIPFAEGGSVSAYDPSRVDAIVNQFM